MGIEFELSAAAIKALDKIRLREQSRYNMEDVLMDKGRLCATDGRIGLILSSKESRDGKNIPADITTVLPFDVMRAAGGLSRSKKPLRFDLNVDEKNKATISTKVGRTRFEGTQDRDVPFPPIDVAMQKAEDHHYTNVAMSPDLLIRMAQAFKALGHTAMVFSVHTSQSHQAVHVHSNDLESELDGVIMPISID